MSTFWTIGVAASLVGTTVLAAMVLALARELGVLLARSGPEYAKPTAQGLDIGTVIEPFVLFGLNGERRLIGSGKMATRNVLIFTSPTCPICEAMMPVIRTFATSYRDVLNVSVISRKEPNDKDQQWGHQLARVGAIVACDAERHQQLQVAMTPFAMLLDTDNAVLARGVFNSLAQLESLIAVQSIIDEHLVASPGAQHVDAGVPVHGGSS